MRLENIKSAADEIIAAALLDEGWPDALEAFATAADAGGASLFRMQNGQRVLAGLSSRGWMDADAALRAGLAPPSRLQFYPDHVFGPGFCVDHDVWPGEAMDADAYYQAFLRPRGVFFHAKVRLCSDAGERVSLSLKHRLDCGPYEPADVAILDTVFAELEAAARIARAMLDAKASGMVKVVHQRGDPVIEFDSWGRVVRVHGGDPLKAGLLIRKNRLAATQRGKQAELERAITLATMSPQRPVLFRTADEQGERRFLQLVPVTGNARDVFQATAALGVIIDPAPSTSRTSFSTLLEEALGFTNRETQVAILLAEGLSLVQVARELHLSTGTARNHLKSIFQKSGARRQSELTAFLAKLRP